MNYSRAAVDSLRSTARELEQRALELRRMEDVLDGEFAARDPETPSAPSPGGSKISPEVAGYGLKRVRCSGCPERPRCPNILERKKIGKVNKCRECHNAETLTRNRLARAKRKLEPRNRSSGKRAFPTLKEVRCSGCSLRPDCSNLVMRYAVRKVNLCFACLDDEAKSAEHRLHKIKQSSSPPRLRSVWHGGEGLSSGASSSLDPNLLPSMGV